MDEQVIKFRVGIVLLAAACVLAILIMSFSTLPDFLKSTYTLNVKFPGASGVAVDSPVRKSGVPIGRVTAVDLEDAGGVMLTIKIDEKYKLRRNERCRIRVDSLVTGDAVVEFIARSPEELLADFDANKNGRLDEDEKTKSSELLKDTDFISDGSISSDPIQVFVKLEEKMASAFTAIQDAGRGVEEASGEVAKLVRGINNVFAGKDDQVRRIMTKSEEALEAFRSTMSSVNQIIGDPMVQSRLKRSLNDLPRLFAEAQTTLVDVQSTLESFRGVADKAESNLNNLEKFTKPLGERAEEIAGNLAGSVENLESLLGQLAKFSESLNSSDGSLGQLIRDRELYDRMKRAVQNVESASKRLRPILEDVRIFADKIAADPRILGVRGAVGRRPTGAGIKAPTRYR